MFKALILQTRHNLSDGRTEFMIRNRQSIRSKNERASTAVSALSAKVG